MIIDMHLQNAGDQRPIMASNKAADPDGKTSN
jgi:hypothetical protein